jgi:hypothetical protein
VSKNQELEKRGAPAMSRERQAFGPDKILGTNTEGWKFSVDHRILTIEK